MEEAYNTKGEQLLEAAVAQILEVSKGLGVNVLALYAFGSVGSPHFHRGSDVDVAILADQALSVEQKLGIISRIDMPGDHSLDLVDMLTVDLEMQHIVLSAHRRVFLHADARERVEDYEYRVWVVYITSMEDVKPIHDEIRRTGIVYGPDYTPKSRYRSKVHKAH